MHYIDRIDTRILSHILKASLIVMVTMLCVAVPARAGQAKDLVVKYDQSQLLRLPRAVSQIIIGNPTIADVAVQSPKLLVVTGKSFGITNIIVLDQAGHIIQDQRVLVQRDEQKVVNLQKGSSRQSYNCSPQCNPMITVGDDTKYFASVSSASERKIKLSEGAASGGGGGE